MEEELAITAYELKGIYIAEDALRMANELNAKLVTDKAILDRNDNKENQIAYLRNEYLYYWLKFDYYNMRSTLSKIDPADVDNGWFIWLKDSEVILGKPHDLTEDKNAAIYGKYFDILMPSLASAGSQMQEAISCYRSGMFYACVCALFPIIENVERKITSFDPSKVFNMSQQLHEHQADSVACFNKGYFETFEKRMNDFLSNHFYAKSTESDPEPKQINRNRILHGIFSREVSKTDCLKLFVLVNSLLQFNDWLNCYRKMREVSSSLDETNKD